MMDATPGHPDPADGAPAPGDDAEPAAGEAEEQEAADSDLWEPLIASIKDGRCVPFLGAGVATPLPTGGALAEELAKASSYPFEDDWNLPRVAQYIATTRTPIFAKQRVRDAINDHINVYRSSHPHEVPANYRTLASFTDIQMYITTNYDDLLEQALREAGRDPVVETCRWNSQLEAQLPKFPQHRGNAPVVFHLHGTLDNVASILVTDDDYVEFLVNFAQAPNNAKMIWNPVRTALSFQELLFIGYRLADVNFRVLMRRMLKQYASSSERTSISIQLQDHPETMTESNRRRAEAFLRKYYESSKITLHWADASQFLTDLATMAQL